MTMYSRTDRVEKHLIEKVNTNSEFVHCVDMDHYSNERNEARYFARCAKLHPAVGQQHKRQSKEKKKKKGILLLSTYPSSTSSSFESSVASSCSAATSTTPSSLSELSAAATVGLPSPNTELRNEAIHHKEDSFFSI